MALNVDDFLKLKPILDQVKSSPTAKISISKSQQKNLANLTDEQFESFLNIIKAPMNTPNPIDPNGIIKNVELLQNSRAQKLGSRASNPAYVKAGEIQARRQRISNYMESQKSAIKFLKQEGKPLNFLEKAIDTKQAVNSSSNAIQQSAGATSNVVNSSTRAAAQAGTAARATTPPPEPAYLDRIRQYKKMSQARIDSRAAAAGAETITEAAVSSSEAIRPAGRMSSRIAEAIGQDTMRAASVIHSSKMGYAAAGIAAVAGVFGFASAGRQKRNMQQEMQSRM